MRKLVVALLFTGGCIEYTPTSSFPPAGVPNERPLEVQTQQDRLVQVTTPSVDVLWVVDNSCSMSEEQAALSANFPVFMDFFLGSGLDYHIGVTSTDTSALNGTLRNLNGTMWLDEATPNPTQVFGQMVVMGTGGSITERGRDPVYQAIEVKSRPGEVNNGFYRPEAMLHVVAISDEEDQSVMSVGEFTDWMLQLKVDPEHVTFSSIVTPPPESYSGNCIGGVTVGYEYIQVTNAVGGILWPICDPDWGVVLEQLGIQAAGLKREYFLSQLPVPDTIEVWVEDQGSTYTFERDVDYTYSQTRNSITFVEFVPTALAEVFIEYDVLGASEG